MEVYVESQSQFHHPQFDRYRVEVGKTEPRRPKWSCAAHGCACGYPLAAPSGPSWVTRSWPWKVTQDIDGNLIIRVM